ncbi:MAG: thioredoxin family protein [Muribaculaceae bacterium]|nr:thioredoxin family protein [Muribaculaceae bacterium]
MKYDEFIKSNTKVLIEFYAEWCGPCQTMGPIMEEVQGMVGEDVSIAQIDIDKNEAEAKALGIEIVPTFIIYKNGKEAWRYSGLMTRGELMEKIENI